MLLHCSHAVLTTQDVPAIARFFAELFDVKPHYEHKEFAEFVLPSGFRVAFFRPVGKAAQFFESSAARGTQGLGLTVKDVDAIYQKILPRLTEWKCQISGPPKDHPWGEKSFLLIDFDGNRWEITQSPTANGILPNRE